MRPPLKLQLITILIVNPTHKLVKKLLQFYKETECKTREKGDSRSLFRRPRPLDAAKALNKRRCLPLQFLDLLFPVYRLY